MRLEMKNDLHNIMNAALTLHKKAVEDIAKIHAEEDTKDEAKIRRAYKVAGSLASDFNGLLNQLAGTCASATASVERARTANSAGHLDNNEYQARLLGEAALIRNLPVTMKQEDIEVRLSVFFGDDMAKTVLKASLTEASESRKLRGVDGFAVDLLLPDVYGLQLSMLEKINQEITGKLQRLSNDFRTGADFVSVDTNQNNLMWAEGAFEGIGLYIDKLPELVKRTYPDGTIKTYNIPAFANHPSDLDIIFGMYRG